MIIIEGCDGTGKTTLANYLCAELDFIYRKEPPFKNPIDSYLDLALTNNNKIIFDRLYFSEAVYSQVKKDGRKEFPIWAQHMIERQLMMTNSIVVHCSSDIDEIKRVFNHRGETFIKFSQINEVVKLFKDRVNVSLLPIIPFNRKEKNSYEKVLVTIKQYLDNYNKFQFNNGLSIGDAFPDDNVVMLVGDKLNGAKKVFYTSKGCAPFLHEALTFNINERYYITNSVKLNDLESDINDLVIEYDKLQPKKVIALGKNASKILQRAGILHDVTNHPQFVKRFKNKQIRQYAKTLK